MNTKNPQDLYETPPYSDEKQTPPGEIGAMDPAPDHGEKSYVGNGLLEGCKVLLTGGDSGIGRAVAIAFAREGADLAISYLSEEKDANDTADLVRDAGRRAVLLPGDLADAATCERVGREALEELGGIDILVNNAAFQRSYASLNDIPDNEFVETYEVNVFAMFRLCKQLLPHIPPGGSIINVASIQSFDPSEGLIAYASSKAAIASFTISLAALAIEQGVRVNAVAPGPVWTPLIPATLPPEKVENFGDNTIFKRAAQPCELAPVFVFLASAQASYVSGEIYGATGGRMPL